MGDTVSVSRIYLGWIAQVVIQAEMSHMSSFQISIPNASNGSLDLTLNIGESVFLLGANGSGKSSVVSRIFGAHSEKARRISAHRQTWFASNSLDMTPVARINMENNIKIQDQQYYSRYRMEYAAERAGVAIYDLIDKDTMSARDIARLVREKKVSEAQEKAAIPSPIEVINKIMRLSNIDIEISVESQQRVMARKSSGSPYSIAEMSDGERNAFLIASDVLTAPSGFLVILDEPERHLHRSIISPLLTLLMAERADCAFVVSTHEVMLPLDNPSAATILVRSCEYGGGAATSWNADLLQPGATVDDDLRKDILGARQKIVFVEGDDDTSLDKPLYSLIFPGVSVIAKKSCRDVEHAVQSLRGVEDLHWISVWGIVDKDNRDADDVERLRRLGVYALLHHSVEALYYNATAISVVTKRLSSVVGRDAMGRAQSATQAALKAVSEAREHITSWAVERIIRNKIGSSIPTRRQIITQDKVAIEIDINKIRADEFVLFDRLIASNDYDAILQRYPIKKTGVIDAVSKSLRLSRSDYEDAVRKAAIDDPEFLAFIRSLFSDLTGQLSK